MADDAPPATKPPPTIGVPPRRAYTFDESAPLRHRPSGNRKFSPGTDAPPQVTRRRSSNFSEYSLKDARKAFQESTDDLLLPKPSAAGHAQSHASSPLHSAPLVFALLPALGGMLFTNGSSIITDIILLGLAAIFLNWSVKLPWEWYHSAQSIRKAGEYDGETMIVEDSEEDNPLSFSQATLDEVPEEEPAHQSPRSVRRVPAHEDATKALYRHEILALLCCFLFPILGAYMLHTIRAQLTRSEGLVSDYNITIFILAAEIRPMAHLVKLIQARTLHLQRIVASNPYDHANGNTSEDVSELVKRLEELEARSFTAEAATPQPSLDSKQSAMISSEVRRNLQPELDALNRAVRRYEKRATLQAFQTESRLQELESRLNDAISLAAAAANNNAKNRGFTSIIIEWAATAIVLPIQAFTALTTLPFKTMGTILSYGKSKVSPEKPPERSRKSANGKAPSTVRLGGPPGRPFKK